MAGAPEYEHIEYKQSLNQWREVVASIAAFATAQGGSVLIGIAQDGRQMGVQLGRNTLEELANTVKMNTAPPQYPSISVDGNEQSAIITLRIDESPVKPVWAFNIPYKRVGRTNQKLSPEETKRLMDATAGRTWDTMQCPGLRMDDLDRLAVERFLQAAGQNPRTTTRNVLENLGLITPKGLCNGAALLFAKEPQRFVPEAQVKCARFVGTKSVHFLDEQTLEGNLLTQPDAAIAFVTRNTQQSIHITGRAEREVVPEYPEEAVREAIVNAICHRDYSATGTVQIRIYDDRLEVWNPGMLPSDLTVEELYKDHPSRPRHPRLARALHRARIIEQWGTGTVRILEACLERGMHRPEFRSEMGVFIVRFRKSLTEVRSQKFNERQEAAIAFAREKGRITRGQYSELFNVSIRQAVNDLNVLVGAGVFLRRGQSRATHYTLATSYRAEDME